MYLIYRQEAAGASSTPPAVAVKPIKLKSQLPHHSVQLLNWCSDACKWGSNCGMAEALWFRTR